eukprot:4382379-Pyramimonas_sp.AAC.1
MARELGRLGPETLNVSHGETDRGMTPRSHHEHPRLAYLLGLTTERQARQMSVRERRNAVRRRSLTFHVHRRLPAVAIAP